MAIYLLSDDIANGQLDVIEVITGASGLLEIWDGVAGSVGVDPGSKLAAMVLPADEWQNAGATTARQKLFNGPWLTNPAILAGTARSGVIKTAAGVAKQRFDVGIAGSGATMIVSTATIVLGIAVQINSFTIVMP